MVFGFVLLLVSSSMTEKRAEHIVYERLYLKEFSL